MMFNSGVNFITNIFDVFLLYYFMRQVFHSKKPIKINTAAVLFLLVSINTGINYIFGLANLLGFLLILMMLTVGFLFLFKRDMPDTFLVLAAGLVFMFVFETAIAYLFVYLFQLTPTEFLELSPLRIAAILASKISFFLATWLGAYRISVMIHIHDKKKNPLTFVLLFNVIIIYMTFILYKYMEIDSSRNYMLLFSTTLAALLFSWLIFGLTKTMVRQEQQEEIMRLKIREYEKQDFYIKNMEDLMTNIRAQRHDLNNYIGTLYGLIQLEQIEEAKKYIMNLEKNISYFNQIIDTKHPVITALINVKYQKAVREKINIDFDINLPESLPIEYLDLSIILGNLLDNAIEACIKSGNETPQIQLKMYIKGNYLVIKGENSKSKEIAFRKEDILPKYTTKEDKENHGFGLQNIQRVVEQYEGIFKLEDGGDIFKVNIALPQKGSTK